MKLSTPFWTHVRSTTLQPGEVTLGAWHRIVRAAHLEEAGEGELENIAALGQQRHHREERRGEAGHGAAAPR
jgi:hypothetical protein